MGWGKGRDDAYKLTVNSQQNIKDEAVMMMSWATIIVSVIKW